MSGITDLNSQLRSAIVQLDTVNTPAQVTVVNNLSNRLLDYGGTLAERDYVYNGFFGWMQGAHPSVYSNMRINGIGANIRGYCSTQYTGRRYVYNGLFGCLERTHPSIYRNGYFGVYNRYAPRVYNRYHMLLNSVEDDLSVDPGELALPLPAIIGIAIAGLILLILAFCGLRTYRKRQGQSELSNNTYGQQMGQYPPMSPSKNSTMQSGTQMMPLPNTSVSDIYQNGEEAPDILDAMKPAELQQNN